MDFRPSFSVLPAQIISVVTATVNDHGPYTDRALRLRTQTLRTRRRPMKLSSKIVLVTGGTSGIGLEAAKLFQKEGAAVIIVGKDPDRLQSAGSEVGDGVTLLRGDVSKPAELEDIANKISEKFGRIDV